jgi:predicted TIM-barrel fold metal-dependent hydrolase
MIIDIHTHIFPKSIRRRRETYFDHERAFCQLYRSPKSRLVGADQLVAAMDQDGIDKAVTFGFPWHNGDTARRHNDYILQAVNRYPDRLIGFGCLDPLEPNAPAEARRCLVSGLAGIGELAFYESDIDEGCIACLEPIMALCRQYDCPVMVHTNEPIGHHYPGKAPNTLAGIYRLIQHFPDNRIILAHWGGGIFFYGLLKKEITQTLSNVWFDTAASPFLYQASVYQTAISIVGPEKILFGTDYPLIPPARYLEEMDQSEIAPEHKSCILHTNAAALLKIGIE